MNVIRNQEFAGLNDYGTGRIVESIRLEHCYFHFCGFSTTQDVQSRSTARNMEIIDCAVSGSDVGPAILEDIHVDGLQIHEIFILWDPLFKHVTLEGKIGSVKINNVITSIDWDPQVQREFDLAREAYYQNLDWALDISRARFSDFSMRGVPARLVRIDPATQGIVTRKSALQDGWREQVRPADDLWIFMIDLFIEDGDADLVLAVPRNTQGRRYRELLDSLNELKDLGVVLNSI